MAEYIMDFNRKIPEACEDCDPCLRFGCEHIYRATARKREEIVRCKDCEYSWWNNTVEYDSEYTCHEIEQLFCTHPQTTEPSSLEVKPDGFCSSGVKRDER